MTEGMVRDDWADRVASFFCSHAPDQACAACFAKAQHAWDKVMDDNETAITAFKANMEVEELLSKVADLKWRAEKKFDWGNFVGVLMGGTLFAFIVYLLFIFGAWLYQLVF